MKPSHILMLLLVAVVWGFNFVPVRIGLNHISPLTFTALRFLFTVFPAIFFVKKPQIAWHKMAAYGLLLYAGQFSCMFTAVHMGLSPGLTSLVLQMQAFFTMALAALVLREKPKSWQVLGAMVAAMGIVVVGLHAGGEVTIPGLLMAVLAALSWSAGNLMTKSFGRVNMFAVIIWGNLYALLFMIPFAALMEGPQAMLDGMRQLHGETLLSLCYIAYISTYVGYTLWSRKLALYSAASVAPFSLLVPAFAMLSTALVFGEPFPLWKFWATLLIMGGLAINQFGGKLVGVRKPVPDQPLV